MLESRLNELMPKYLQLYESTKVNYNPFTNFEYEKNHSQTRKGGLKITQPLMLKGLIILILLALILLVEDVELRAEVMKLIFN